MTYGFQLLKTSSVLGNTLSSNSTNERLVLAAQSIEDVRGLVELLLFSFAVAGFYGWIRAKFAKIDEQIHGIKSHHLAPMRLQIGELQEEIFHRKDYND